MSKRQRIQGSYNDILDGAAYKSLPHGYTSKPANISVTLNTDGVPVFRSSGFSFWPIYLTINELPDQLR